MVKDKARVRARIAALFPKAAHMAQKRIDAIADRLEATDDSTDEEIDTELETINDSGLATFEDIVRTDDQLAAAQKKKDEPKKEDPKKEEDDKLDPTDPAAILKRMENLEKQLAAEKEKNTKEALTTRFKNDPRLKDVPAFMLNRAVPQSEEEFEDVVTSLSEEYKAFAIQNNISKIDNDAPPAGDGKTPKKDTVKEASDTEVDKIADYIL